MNRRAHLSLLVVVVIWAGSFSVIKALLDDGVAAADIALVRYLIAAPGFAYILWRARGLPGLTRSDGARVVVAGLLIVVGYHVFLNVGEQHTTSGIAALVVALAPGMTMLLAIALGLDRVSMRRVVGLVVAFSSTARSPARGASTTAASTGRRLSGSIARQCVTLSTRPSASPLSTRSGYSGPTCSTALAARWKVCSPSTLVATVPVSGYGRRPRRWSCRSRRNAIRHGTGRVALYAAAT